MMIPVLFSAALLYFSFPNIFFLFGCWPLAWFFSVPLFFALSRRENSWPGLLAAGSLFGLFSYAALVNWLIPYSPAGYLFFVLVLSIQPVIFVLLFKARPQHIILNLLYVPGAWVASEYIRNFLMQGFSWNIGLSQSFNLPVLQIADLAGPYGISFVLILVNYCFYLFLVRRTQRKTCAAAALGVLALVLSYGFFSLRPQKVQPQESLRICAIQPNVRFSKRITLEEISRFVDPALALTEQCIEQHLVDMIVWPETAVPTDFLQDKELSQKFKQLAQKAHAFLLIGAALSEGEKDFNTLVLLDPQGRAADIYHKQYLVPFSEYLPNSFIARTVKNIFKFENYEFTAGEKPGVFNLPAPLGKFGVAICSEDTTQVLFREFVKAGAGFAVVALNDGWFKQDAGVVMHAQNAIMRAVENRMPVVRVSNSGWTCFIDANGRVKKDAPAFNTPAFAVNTVCPRRQRTLYNLFPDTFCLGCAGFVIINLIRARLTRDGRKSS